ncbi:hypothetical protein chiPu_0028464, partial [Chiloscyllium punctatum]|nr:hypothetical protein [Chiloscyllium punctatum]
MNALGNPVARALRFAELEASVAIDRRVLALHHRHEDLGLRKDLPDRRRGIGIGASCVVAAERLLLGADHVLRCPDIVGRGRR